MTRVVQDAEPTLFTCKFSNWAPESDLASHEGMAAAARRQAQATKLLPPGTVEGQVRMWRVNAFKKVEVPPALHGLFYAGDTYIVHYSYTVRNRTMHLLYHWHGRVASADEKGSAALLCKEIDDKELDGSATQARAPHESSDTRGRGTTRHESCDPPPPASIPTLPSSTTPPLSSHPSPSTTRHRPSPPSAPPPSDRCM